MRLNRAVWLLVLLAVPGCESEPTKPVDPVSSRLSLGSKAILYADDADTVFTMLSPRGGAGQNEICFPTVGTSVVVVDDSNRDEGDGRREVKVRIEDGAYGDRVGMVSRKNLRLGPNR